MEDYHGMINLPVPRSQRYQAQGGRGSVSLGRMQPGGVGLPNVVSGLAIGGPSVARGLDQWADVLYKQEQERQDMETVKEMTLFQDKEREFQARMLQTKGLSAYESFRMTEDFYKTNGQELSGKARGTYQKEIYAKFLAGRSAAGKDLAVRHQIAQHDVYKDQVFAGVMAGIDGQIQADPANYEQYSAEKAKVFTDFNHDAAPEWQAAQIDAMRRQDTQAAFNNTVAKGDIKGAREIMQRAYQAQPQGGQGMRVQGARFSLPMDEHFHITSHFGPRQAPQTPKGLGSSDHQGIDLRVPVGTPVKAVSGGTIDFIGDRGGYGLAVIIKHDDGSTTSQYGHLSQFAQGLKKGDRVSAGQVVALSGNTGKSTGPHLDLKITENGRYVDPAPLLGLTGKGPAGPLERGEASAKARGEQQEVRLASLGGLPAGLSVAAGDEASLSYGGLVPPAQLADMQSTLDKSINAQAKAEDAEMKRLGNEIQKNMTIKWYSGGLTQDDVMANRDYFSPDDFDKYMARANNGLPAPAQSDRETLVKLRAMAARRDPDYQSVLDENFKNLRLTEADYSAYSNLGEKSRAPVYKQAEQIIKLKTGRSEMNPNPAADLSYLKAMGDFESWLDSEAGQKAGDTERLKMADRIGDNYRLVDLENNLLGVPAPLFLVGGRTSPDIEATREATNRAYEEGRISQEQYLEEAKRLKKMADIIQSRQEDMAAGQKRNSR